MWNHGKRFRAVKVSWAPCRFAHSKNRSTNSLYLAGPPISADDLEVLAEVDTLAPSRLAADTAGAESVRATICQAVDAARFPWISEGREAEPGELEIAIKASAALMTAQRISTDRRNEGKAAQEALVQETLRGIGFDQVATRTIRVLADGPAETSSAARARWGRARPTSWSVCRIAGCY